jgi:hypothetical protein
MIRARLLAAIGLAALFGGMAVIVMQARDGEQSEPAARVATAPATTLPAVAAKPKPTVVKISVTGIRAYDPEGDQTENDSQASLATDGNATTGWKSEHYRTTFHKSGIGLVLDAGKPVRATQLTVTTDTPGYSAQIQSGNSATGPFTPVSISKTTTARTVFPLKANRSRYLVVWITSMPLGGVAAVDEVAVKGRR